MTIARRTGWLLIGFGVWSWIIWPTFLRNIWGDDRSWDHGATAFFLVHLVLTVVSLVFGTAIGLLGWRAVRAGGGSIGPGSAPVSPARVGPARVEPERLGVEPERLGAAHAVSGSSAAKVGRK